MDINVSVVMPTCGRSELLERSIESVLNQSYKKFELIIIGDGVSRDTDKVINQYSDNRVRYFKHQKNEGSASARNTGIYKSKGKYLTFLDDDDEYRRRKIEMQLDVMKNSPENVELLYCWMNYYTNSGQLVKRYQPNYEGYVFPEVLDRQRIGGCPTLFIRREVVTQIGGFDDRLRRGNDGDFIRRVCHKYKVKCLPKTLVNVYVDHKYERISQTSEKSAYWEIKSQKYKLVKFRGYVNRYPRRFAFIANRIALRYAQINNYKKSIKYSIWALSLMPFSLDNLLGIAKSVGYLFRKIDS
ncbi:MAG: glycosyltransferase family 2 protein [Candidatus Paceibacteria bacterium]